MSDNFITCWNKKSTRVLTIILNIVAFLLFSGGIALIILDSSEVIGDEFFIVGLVLIGLSVTCSITLGIMMCVARKCQC